MIGDIFSVLNEGSSVEANTDSDAANEAEKEDPLSASEQVTS